MGEILSEGHDRGAILTADRASSSILDLRVPLELER